MTDLRPTVLLVGGTGRTGGRVLGQLLGRGAAVRAIARSAARLPADVTGHPGLAVVEADLSSLPDADLARHVRGCDAVVSCLGHGISLAGIFGPPHDLVTRAVSRLCRAVEASPPPRPARFVVMTSVSVSHPGGADPRRSPGERAVMTLLRALVPPVRDNQGAADFLFGEVGAAHPCVEWAVVRPDTLLAGEVSAYALHPSPVSSIFRPDTTRMANVAHFMCELVMVPAAWEAWRGGLPVIVDEPVPAGRP